MDETAGAAEQFCLDEEFSLARISVPATLSRILGIAAK